MQGFNVIATANDRDRGVNDLSSALGAGSTPSCCRCPATDDEEVEIVAPPRRRSSGRALELPADADAPRRDPRGS